MHTQAKTLITARQWRTTIFPFLCTAIKIAVSYSNRQFTHTTSQTTHITKGNYYCFCKLRALLCCAALKCICPTNLIPQTARTAPLLEPPQSRRPRWGTPALEHSHRQVEGGHRARPCPCSLLHRQRLSTTRASNMAQHSQGHKATGNLKPQGKLGESFSVNTKMKKNST